MNQEKHPALPSLVLGSLAALSGILFCWAACSRFCPGIAGAPLFTSDSAIPVIMSRSPYPSFFSVYFYGQDRFGAFPFLFHAVLAKLFGFQAGPETLYVQLCGCFLLGLFFFFRRTMGSWSVGFAAFAVATMLFCFDRSSVNQIFDLSKVYPWQASLLLCILPFVPGLIVAPKVRPRYAAACGLACLAAWINPLSAAFLVVAIACCYRFRGKALMAPFAALVLIPAIFEAFLRNAYHVYSRRAFGVDYSFPLEGVDIHHFWTHLCTAWGTVDDSLTRSAVFIAIIAIALGLRKRPLSIVGPWMQGVIAIAIAATNLLVCSMSHYVIRNGLDARYLFPTRLFLLLAAILFLTEAIRMRNWPSISLLVASAALVTGLVWLPPKSTDVRFQELKAKAAALASHPQPVVVMGQYWDTYVYAALAPAGTLDGLPLEHDYDRMPWVGERILPGAKTIALLSKSLPESFNDRGYRFRRIGQMQNDIGLYHLLLP